MTIEALPIQRNRLPGDIRVSLKAAVPRRVAQDRHRISIRNLVFFRRKKRYLGYGLMPSIEK